MQINENWEYQQFDTLFDWCEKSKIKSGEGKQNGKYKMFVCSDTDVKYYDEYLKDSEALVFGTGGKASCHYANDKFAYSTDCIVAVKKCNELLTKFYFYFFRQQNMKLIQQTFTGSGLEHTSKKKIGQLLVPVPSLFEQMRIVAKIEELFSELDRSVAMLKKVKEQLEVYRQAVIDSVFENISENKKIADICEYVTDGDHLPPPKTDTGIPFIMISNVNGNRICWDKTAFVSNEYYKNISFQRKPKKGDVLYTVTGSFGIPILVDFEKKFCFQRHIALLSPKNIVKQKFLYYALQTTGVYMQAVAKATGTAQKTVSLSVLRNMTIPFFDELNVQTNIIDRLDKQLQDCEFMSLNVNNSLQQADALRQSILKKAFEGEL